MTISRKPTHTDQYLNFNSHHPLIHKRSVVRTLTTRAQLYVTTAEDRRAELSHVRNAPWTNNYKAWALDVPPTTIWAESSTLIIAWSRSADGRWKRRNRFTLSSKVSKIKPLSMFRNTYSLRLQLVMNWNSQNNSETMLSKVVLMSTTMALHQINLVAIHLSRCRANVEPQLCQQRTFSKLNGPPSFSWLDNRDIYDIKTGPGRDKCSIIYGCDEKQIKYSVNKLSHTLRYYRMMSKSLRHYWIYHVCFLFRASRTIVVYWTDFQRIDICHIRFSRMSITSFVYPTELSPSSSLEAEILTQLQMPKIYKMNYLMTLAPIRSRGISFGSVKLDTLTSWK